MLELYVNLSQILILSCDQKCQNHSIKCLNYLRRSLPEILVGDAIRLTEVTVEVLLSQMAQKVVVVEEAIITELAQRMTFV